MRKPSFTPWLPGTKPELYPGAAATPVLINRERSPCRAARVMRTTRRSPIPLRTIQRVTIAALRRASCVRVCVKTGNRHKQKIDYML
jgi:superfamily II RNA helicase